MPDDDDSVIAREAARMMDEYDRRAREIAPDVYDATRPANLFRLQQRMRWSLTLLREAGLLPLTSRRILEVGCGSAFWLAEMALFGARPEHLAGIDLSGARAADARARFGGGQTPGRPAPDIRQGDATRLPWPDDSFDIVLQSTVFSSILSDQVQALVAGEILRVLAPGGVLLWYDLRVGNPRNPSVRGIPPARLRELFPSCAIRSRTICLAPPVARWLVPRSWALASALEALRVLNTATIATIRKITNP